MFNNLQNTAAAFLFLAATGVAEAASSAAQPEVLASWSQIVGNSTAPDPNADTAPLNIHMRFVFRTSSTDAQQRKKDCDRFNIISPTGSMATVDWNVRSNDGFPSGDSSNPYLVVCDAPMPEHFGATALVDSDQSSIRLGGTSPVAGQNIVFPGSYDVGRSKTKGQPKTKLSMTVFGDSGCRGYNGQDCFNGSSVPWVFGTLVEQATKQKDVDVVVHVGDYRYKDKHSHDFPHWQSDFFNAAQISLLQVPWAIVRGNHESCQHGYSGEGWFLLFGPKNQEKCKPNDDRTVLPVSYFDLAVREKPTSFGHHRVFMVDTSPTVYPRHRSSGQPRTCDVSDTSPFCQLKQQFETTLLWGNIGWNGGKQLPSSWIATHRPVWGLDTQYRKQNDKSVADALEQAAVDLAKSNPGGVRNCVPYNSAKCGLKAVLAGHQHLLENIVFPLQPAGTGQTNWMLPQQFVVGNSGVKLRTSTKNYDFHSFFETGGGMANCPVDDYGSRSITGVVVDWYSRQYSREGKEQFPFGYVNYTRPAAVAGEQSGWSGMASFYTESEKNQPSKGWSQKPLTGQAGTTDNLFAHCG